MIILFCLSSSTTTELILKWHRDIFFPFYRCISRECRLLFRNGSRQENIGFLRLIDGMIQYGEKEVIAPPISTIIVFEKSVCFLALSMTIDHQSRSVRTILVIVIFSAKYNPQGYYKFAFPSIVLHDTNQ